MFDVCKNNLWSNELVNLQVGKYDSAFKDLRLSKYLSPTINYASHSGRKVSALKNLGSKLLVKIKQVCALIFQFQGWINSAKIRKKINSEILVITNLISRMPRKSKQVIPVNTIVENMRSLCDLMQNKTGVPIAKLKATLSNIDSLEKLFNATCSNPAELLIRLNEQLDDRLKEQARQRKDLLEGAQIRPNQANRVMIDLQNEISELKKICEKNAAGIDAISDKITSGLREVMSELKAQQELWEATADDVLNTSDSLSLNPTENLSASQSSQPISGENSIANNEASSVSRRSSVSSEVSDVERFFDALEKLEA